MNTRLACLDGEPQLRADEKNGASFFSPASLVPGTQTSEPACRLGQVVQT